MINRSVRAIAAGAIAGLVALALLAVMTFAGAALSIETRAPGVWPPAHAAAAQTFDWGRAAPVPPARRVIEVRGTAPGWPVRSAGRWLDGYTASTMRFVSTCSGTAYRCLTVRSGAIAGGAVGKLSGNTITIDTAKAGSAAYRKHYGSRTVRKWLVAHELAHAFGLKHRGGANLMNPTVTRGKLALSPGQRKHLRAR